MGTELYLKRVYKNAETGTESNIFSEALDSDELTVRPNWLPTRYNRQTCIKEVKILPWESVMDVENLRDVSVNSIDMTFKKYSQEFHNGLVRHIEEVYQPDKTQIILHSSGYDSRLLGLALRDVIDNDNYIIVCQGPESEYVPELLELEGWDVDRFVVLPWDREYFEWALDYKTSWRKLNGPASYPINDAYYIWSKMLEFGVPEDSVLWRGQFFNEIFWYLGGQRSKSLGLFLENWYYSAIVDFMMLIPNLMNPILNKYTIRHLAESTQMSGRHTRMRIVKELHPKLGKVARQTNPRGYYIPDDIMDKSLMDYCQSKYARSSAVTRTKAYSRWWARWSLASMLDEVIG